MSATEAREALLSRKARLAEIRAVYHNDGSRAAGAVNEACLLGMTGIDAALAALPDDGQADIEVGEGWAAAHSMEGAEALIMGVALPDDGREGFVRCPLCGDPERVEDIVGGVCLTCADGIAFAQNARRGSIEVPIETCPRCGATDPDSHTAYCYQARNEG